MQQALCYRSGKSSPDASLNLLIQLRRHEHEEGWRLFPLRSTNSLISLCLGNKFQNSLDLDPSADMVDVMHIDFALRGYNDDAGRAHPVTVLTCDAPETVKHRVSSLCSHIDAFNREVIRTLPEHRELCFKYKKGNIRCFCAKTFSQRCRLDLRRHKHFNWCGAQQRLQ